MMTAEPEMSEPDGGTITQTRFWIALVVIVAVTMISRLYAIGTVPIWMDEAFTYVASKQNIGTIVFGRIDNHPPLFYVLEHYWLAIFNNLQLLRVPAALCGTATVLVCSLAAKDLISRRVGLLTGGFLLVSTGQLYMSQEARMYTLVTTGLGLALWGLVGLYSRTEHKRAYSALYLAGSLIAIYSQFIALPCLLSMNIAVMSSRAIAIDKWKHWLALNTLLFIAALPWLMNLTEAAETYPVQGENNLLLLPWHASKMMGFPGLPGGLRQAANLFLVAVASYGGRQLWRQDFRVLVRALVGLVVLYPIVLAALSLHTPLLSSKIFLPCTIGVAILTSAALDAARKGAVFWCVATAIFGLSLASLTIEREMRAKMEDIPQVIAIAYAAGFDQAPILTCTLSTALTAHVSAPGRKILASTDQGVLVYDDKFERVFQLPISKGRQMGPKQLNDAIGGGNLYDGIPSALARDDKVVLVGAKCGPDREKRDREILTDLGFHRLASPDLVRPKREIIGALRTTVELWERGSGGAAPKSAE